MFGSSSPVVIEVFSVGVNDYVYVREWCHTMVTVLINNFERCGEVFCVTATAKKSIN